MRAYFIRRILLIIPTVILASIMVFLVIRLIPGNLVDLMEDKTILVYQTVKRGTAQNAPYVVSSPGTQQGAFIDITDDKGIADAVRAAVNGKLP